MGFPCFSASAKTVSRCPFGSFSIPQGAIPPTSSAPMARASSISSAVPGRVIMPDCGKATISMSIMPFSFSRVAMTPSMPASP